MTVLLAFRITCRVCGEKADAHEDAVLICDACRAEADAMARGLERQMHEAADRFAALLQNADAVTVARLANVVAARMRAVTPAQRERYGRRYQQALDARDGLTALLLAERHADETRARCQAGLDELEMLA